MTQFEWSHEDRFRSNGGKGPLISRILCATDKYLKMELWNERSKNPQRRQFKLSAKFLSSPSCGWRKIA